MLRLLGLSGFYWVLAADDAGGGGFDLAVYGVAGTTVAILLYFIKILWSDNKELRSENNTIQQLAIERVATIATQSADQLKESADTLQATTVMMHTLAGRPGLSPEQLAEVNYHLRYLREKGQG